MQALEYKRELYAKKVSAFNTLRAGAAALANGRDKYRKLEVWAPSTHQGASDQLEKQHLFGRDIGGVTHYFDNKVSSALDVICEDEFTIHYQIYGDIGREAMFGSNTVGMFVHMRWEQLEIQVGLYPGTLDRLLAREKLTTAAREGIPDRDQVAKATGWAKDRVRQLQDDEMAAFKGLLENVKVGQSKLTRLVKGFLMLLECMERGHIDIVLGIQNSILYGPQAVINSYRMGGRAYVYNSRPSQAVHSAVLWRMCEAYPPPELANSHVTIPSDGRHVFMVTEGQLVGNGNAVRLNPNLIYASIMTYAMDTGCTNHLQQALIIACSLQQNRYFTKVKLPVVSSTYDLMIPAFMQPNTKLDKPIVSLPMSKSIGRLHQMLMFTAIRDNLTAAELSTTNGFDPEVSMRSFLKSQRLIVSRMSSYISELSLMEATSSLRVHDNLDTADFRDILSISVFEGLWLCQEVRKSVANGVIEALVRGVSDMSQDTSTYDVLTREMRLANVVFNPAEMPKGEFTVGWVNVTRLNSYKTLPKRTRTRRAMELVRECDFTPRVREVGKRRQRFRKGAEFTDTPATAIPMEDVRRRAERRHQRGSSSSSRYESAEGSVSSVPPYGSEPELPVLPEPPVAEITTASTLPQYQAHMPSSSATSSEEAYARSVLAAEAAGKKPSLAAKVDKIVGDVSSQLTEDERIAKRLKEMTRGKMTEKERISFTRLVKNIGATSELEASRDQETFIRSIERQQKLVSYKGEIMVGNSNLAKEINLLIDKGREPGTGTSVVDGMRTKGKLWTGAIEGAPHYAIKYVINSEAWDTFLKAKGVDPSELTRLDPRTTSTTMKVAVGQKISAMPHGSVGDVAVIAAWLRGVHNDRFPAGLNRNDIANIGLPEELEYRIAPSSVGPRDPDESDSRWLVLASRVDHKVFDFDYLKNLCKHFIVPAAMRDSLRETYGLFDKSGNSMTKH